MHQNVRYELYMLESLVASGDSCLAEPEARYGKKTIKNELARIRRSIIENAFTLENELLRRYIRFHHEGVIALMDEIRSKTHNTAHEHHKILGAFLLFLEKHFKEFLDTNTHVPAEYVSIFKSHVSSKLQNLEHRLREAGADTESIEILTSPFRKLLANAPEKKLSYHRFRYLHRLLTQLLQAVDKQGSRYSVNDFRLLMYYMNYNRDKSFTCITRLMLNKTEQCDSNQEKIERLSFFLKEAIQAPVRPDTKYHENRMSLKDQVITFLSGEIDYLKHFCKPSKNDGSPVDKVTSAIKLNLDISVSQLAYIIRVLLELKVIRNENTAELLRLVASSCTTKRSETISVGSLRGRFYEVDFSTRESVKKLVIETMAYIGKSRA